MLSKCLTNPHILSFIGANEQNEVVPGGIVGV
jgi:hypothetical protein